MKRRLFLQFLTALIAAPAVIAKASEPADHCVVVYKGTFEPGAHQLFLVDDSNQLMPLKPNSGPGIQINWDSSAGRLFKL